MDRDHVRTRAWIIISTPQLSDLQSNPEFVNDHLQNMDEFRDRLILYAPSEDDMIHCYALNGLMKLSEADYPEQFESMLCEFVGDEDGLVCLLFDFEHVAVCNPVLKKWTIPANIALPFYDIPSTAAEFESDAIITCYGFGKVNGDYKILRLCEWGKYQGNDKIREFAAYSLSSGSWSVEHKKVSNNLCNMCEAHCVGGWINHRCYHNIIGSVMIMSNTVISAVNLSDFTERELQLPRSCLHKSPEHFYLCRLHDRLGLVDMLDMTSMKVWGMIEYGHSDTWQVMFHLPSSGWGFPRGYLPERNELIMVESRSEDKSLVVYLYDTNNVRRLERVIKANYDPPTTIDTCVASLVTPPQGE